MEITDSISEALLRTVMKYALILKREPHNYEARAEVMWAGSLSHNGLTGCGTDGGDWACHKLEHELGGMYDVAHGAGLTALWGTWAKYVYKNKPDRFARLAVKVLGVTQAKIMKIPHSLASPQWRISSVRLICLCHSQNLELFLQMMNMLSLRANVH